MPEAQYEIVAHNPNVEHGGGDLCYPHKQVEGVEGPWVIFPSVDVAEAQGDTPLNHASLAASQIEEIYHKMKGVKPDYTGGEGDIRDKIAQQSAVTVAWEDVPVEIKASLLAAFPAGGRVKFSGGCTDVPPADQPRFPGEVGVTTPEGGKLVIEGQNVRPATDADVALLRDAPPLEPNDADLALLTAPDEVQLEPGDKPGDYLPVVDEQGDEVSLR